MRVFGVTIGCPVAIFHCEHVCERRDCEDTLTTAFHCKRTQTIIIAEQRKECCKCDWVSDWLRDEPFSR